MWPFKKEERRLGPVAVTGIFASLAASAAALWYYLNKGKNNRDSGKSSHGRSSHGKH